MTRPTSKLTRQPSLVPFPKLVLAVLVVCCVLVRPTMSSTIAGLYTDGSWPASSWGAAGGAYTWGLCFTTSANMYITAIMFYKDSSSSLVSTYAGHTRRGALYTTAGGGALVAGSSVTFAGETASGWQTQALSSTIAIAANTGICAAVLMPLDFNLGPMDYTFSITSFANVVSDIHSQYTSGSTLAYPSSRQNINRGIDITYSNVLLTLPPTTLPTVIPTALPTSLPTSAPPTARPTSLPSPPPTALPTAPAPTARPTAPSFAPSTVPTPSPTARPTPKPARMNPAPGPYFFRTNHGGFACSSTPNYYTVEYQLNTCMPPDEINPSPSTMTCTRSSEGIKSTIWSTVYAPGNAACSGPASKAPLVVAHPYNCEMERRGAGYALSQCGDIPLPLRSRAQVLIKAYPQGGIGSSSSPGSALPAVNCYSPNVVTRAYVLGRCLQFKQGGAKHLRYHRKFTLVSAAGPAIVLRESRFSIDDSRCDQLPYLTVQQTYSNDPTGCLRDPLDASMAYIQSMYHDGKADNWGRVDAFIRAKMVPTAAPTATPTAPSPRPTAVPTLEPTRPSAEPTFMPSPVPSPLPTSGKPTPTPTALPTSLPTAPTFAPTPTPTPGPTIATINFRYLQWSVTGGSTSNDQTHFCEIQATTAAGVNRLLNLGNTGGVTQCCGTPNFSRGNYQLTTDGDLTANNYMGWYAGPVGLQYDLGAAYSDIVRIKFWHYWADGRTYYGVKIAISLDGTTWTTLYGPQNAPMPTNGNGVIAY